MKNIKLKVAYDGTNYFGFQEQKGSDLPTIQEELEKCLSTLAKKEITIIASGRTDSGVHAKGQIVNFRIKSWPIPLDKTPLAINSLLPKDIIVTEAREVSFDFHARFSAKSKTYLYRIYNSKIADPFEHRYTYLVPQRLNIEAMQKGANFLIGEHNFKAFRAVGTPVKSTIRTIYEIKIKTNDPLIEISITGNGFLYNMVRIIVGTLLKVGVGKMEPEYLETILASQKRELGGPTIPPQGLYLMTVDY